MSRHSLGRSPALLGLAALVAACAMPPQPEPDLRGAALEALYRDTETAIANRGGMRTERAPKDAPLTIPLLVRNFEEIAFFSEFSREGGGPLRTARAIPLTRWEGPVRVGLVFGDSVPPDQQRADLADVQNLLRRFREITGRDIVYRSEGDVNFLVLVLERGEQVELARQIATGGAFPAALARDLRNSPPSLLCSASLFGPAPDDGGIAMAVAIIKAEHKGLMRQSCLHEEMTQAMGLLNDSRTARPSIFNDDEEFALLTLHDEILLRMLYDPRLRIGMTLDEARPLLPRIAMDAARARGAEIR